VRPAIESAAEEILGLYFPVLDHGFVSLVDVMGDDAAVEQAARVSYGSGTRKVSETRDLLRYLMRHQHTTPLEMVELKFHCAMPMFIARQWIRHRTASVNEYSGRYSVVPAVFYTPEAEQFRSQSKTNKQGRGEQLDPGLHHEAVMRWQFQRDEASAIYDWLLAEDVARELARIDLPLSTYTQWYWKIDLHNLLHFLKLRVDGHAQWEFQQYGQVMAAMVARIVPLVYEAWIDYEVCGTRLSLQERMILDRMINAQGNARSMISVSDGKRDVIADMNGNKVIDIRSREVEEFIAKLNVPERPVFSIDPATSMTAGQVREKWEDK
jgi:thymidylate synthase (FAD)